MDKLRRLISQRPPSKCEEKPQEKPKVQQITTELPTRASSSANPPRLLLIGAGSRGATLARAISEATNGNLVAVADPDPERRKHIGRRYVWMKAGAAAGQEFDGWKDFLEWELVRRQAESENEKTESKETGWNIDAAVICTPDHTHREIVTALAPLGLHIMCEKPLAASLNDCLDIAQSLGVGFRPGDDGEYVGLFAIGHVMRYAPIHRMIRKLICEDDAIGDIISIEHTETVGWWHFAHSYVRGNWRNEITSGPSLLTKSCHDIDFLMWLMCSPTENRPAHLPSRVTAFGDLNHFRRARKPPAAGTATNCLSCPAETTCHYSAQQIYNTNSLKAGLPGWPVNVVVPEIEDLITEKDGYREAEKVLMQRLEQDYTSDTPKEVIDQKQWYGRCVYESDNNVCDDQTVHIAWDDVPLASDGSLIGQTAKSATFHMTAFGDGICVKRTKIHGTKGELEYNGQYARRVDFRTGIVENLSPPLRLGGHKGGDHGLMKQFVMAIDAVKNEGMSVQQAQKVFLACSVEDIIRSHAMVFAAEEARKTRSTVDWEEWWRVNVLKSDTNDRY